MISNIYANRMFWDGHQAVDADSKAIIRKIIDKNIYLHKLNGQFIFTPCTT
jgi:hypothetical protein